MFSKKSPKKGVPDDGNPWSTSSYENSSNGIGLGSDAIFLVIFVCVLLVVCSCFLQKKIKTAVPDDEEPRRALVLTKLSESKSIAIKRKHIFVAFHVSWVYWD